MDQLLKLISERAGHWLAVQVAETKIALSAGDAVSAVVEARSRLPNRA